MWLLVQEAREGDRRADIEACAAKWALLPGNEYRIGCQDCDIQIQDNETVSRLHARLSIHVPETSPPGARPEVLLEDLSSKYGTFLNGAILNPNTSLEDVKSGAAGRQLSKPTRLKDNDRILFGLLRDPIFRLKWWSLEVTSSMLKDKTRVNSWLNTISPGTRIQSNWSDNTTHLIMSSIFLSIKVVNCLAKGVPIVTPEYFRDCSSACASRQPLPEAGAYVPPVSEADSESQLRAPGISFAINTARSKLFAGKTFVFLLEEQMKELGVPIRLAGGSCLMVNTTTTMEPDLLARPGHLLVKPKLKAGASQTQSEQLSGLSQVLVYLERRALAPVPSLEVYLAIVYCDTQRFCNPARPSRLMSIASSTRPGHPSAKPGRVRATETQSSPGDSPLIPASGEPDSSAVLTRHSSISSQRTTTEEEDTQILQPAGPAGKRWLDSMPKKRALSSDDEDLAPAAKKGNSGAANKTVATSSTEQTISSGSRDMFASATTTNPTGPSADHKENRDTANQLKPPAEPAVRAEGKLLKRQVAGAPASRKEKDEAENGNLDDVFGFGTEIRAGALNRSRNLVSVPEDDDIFGFGPADDGPRKPAEQSRSLMFCQETQNGGGSRPKQVKVDPELKQRAGLKPDTVPAPSATDTSLVNLTSNIKQARQELDSSGFIGKDSFVKRAEIKKEDSGEEAEILSKSFGCISFVKLFRSNLPRPKYVPSDIPSLLGKPVKDFKKFHKQALAKSEARVGVVTLHSVNEGISTWMTENADVTRRIHEQEEQNQKAEDFWNFSQSQQAASGRRQPALVASRSRR